jgi:hypothetical protein
MGGAPRSRQTDAVDLHFLQRSEAPVRSRCAARRDHWDPVQITHFSAGKIFSFDWSRDGRWLSLGSGVNRSDVVLMSRQP